MTTQGEQNGGQSHNPPVQSVAPTDPRLRKVPTTSNDNATATCKSFILTGICNKQGQCKLRHFCTLDEMMSLATFCPQFVRTSTCSIPNCSHFHITKEEEYDYLTKRQVPQALLDRHAAINASGTAAMAGNNTTEAAQSTYAAQLPLPSTSSVPLPPSVLMPPPPPPPLPNNLILLSDVASAIHYSAPPGPSTSAATVPLNIIDGQIRIDTSVPPPPIINSMCKRVYSDFAIAGPSREKIRKPNNCLGDMPCEKCIQRNRRCEQITKENENLEEQIKCKEMLLSSKELENRNMKSIMRFMLPTTISSTIQETLSGNKDTASALMMELSQTEEMFVRFLLNASSEHNSSPEPSTSGLLDNTSPSLNGFSQFVTGLKSEGAILPGLSSTLEDLRAAYVNTPSKVSTLPVLAAVSSRTVASPPPAAAATPAPAAAATPAQFVPFQPNVPPPSYAPFQPGVPPPPFVHFQPGVPPPSFTGQQPPPFTGQQPPPFNGQQPPPSPFAAPQAQTSQPAQPFATPKTPQPALPFTTQPPHAGPSYATPPPTASTSTPPFASPQPPRSASPFAAQHGFYQHPVFPSYQ
ncbi:hypothetical protein ACJJTC_000847 [Scirpophaga incertulas]